MNNRVEIPLGVFQRRRDIPATTDKTGVSERSGDVSRAVCVRHACALAVMVLIALTGCEKPPEVAYPMKEMGVGFIRGEYARNILKDLNTGQFLGDVHGGVRGGDAVVAEAWRIATEAFPDGEYVGHIGQAEQRQIPGYRYIGVVLSNSWYWSVYRKESPSPTDAGRGAG